MPLQFFLNKEWKKALMKASLTSSTMSILYSLQSSNILPSEHRLLPIMLGGVVSVAPSIAKGVAISSEGNLVGVINLYLNYLLPQCLSNPCDGDSNRANIGLWTSLILATLCFILATSIIEEANPVVVPKASLPTQQIKDHTEKRKQKFVRVKQKNIAPLSQTPQVIPTTGSSIHEEKGTSPIEQIKAQINNKYEHVTSMANKVLGQIIKSELNLNTPDCKVKKKSSKIQSNFTRKKFIETVLNAYEKKRDSWVEQLEQVSTSEPHLDKYALMLQEGKTLLTHLCDFAANLQKLNQDMDKQLAWEQKQAMVSQIQLEPTVTSIRP